MRKQIDGVFAAFEHNLVPIIVTILTSYVLFAPAQFREIHRALAQRIAALQTIPLWYDSPDFWSAIWASLYMLGSLTAFCILLWMACRVNVPEAELPEGKAAIGARRFVSLGLAILPFLALSLGLYAASSGTDALKQITDLLTKIMKAQLEAGPVGLEPSLAETTAADWAAKVASYNNILIGAAVLFALLGLLLLFLLNRFESSKRAYVVGRAMSGGYAALGAAVIFLGLCAVYASQSGAAAVSVSAVPILLTFATLSLVIVNYLAVQSGRIGRLAVWLLATVAIVFSLFDSNNNHRVRRISYAAQAALTPPELPDTFLKWYNARTDQAKFSGRYPIYIVAAQGGGIYAAMHAAHFLSYMQARCPNFAHHLFAISGVSGGSVGSAVFVAAMKEAEQRGAVKIPEAGCNSPLGSSEDPSLLSAVADILDDDFWSPLQSMWLFPDLLQRFIPVPIEMFDRARALELGLEASWQRSMTRSDHFGQPKVSDVNTMAEPFMALWPQGVDKSLFTPALVLNTTEVDSGRRRLIAPFRFEGLTDLKFLPVSCISTSGSQTSTAAQTSRIEAVPLSTAAVLSARFPWVTPTGWFYARPEPDQPPEPDDCAPPNKRVSKVTDGGYFESSGVATALDLAHSLQKIIMERQLNIDIKLVILTSGTFASETADGLNEALDPIRTLLNASEARGYIEVGRAEKADFARANAASDAVLKVSLKEYGYPLPLGWSLSTVTKYLILFQTGELNLCEPIQGPRRPMGGKSSKCVIGDIVTQLTHR